MNTDTLTRLVTDKEVSKSFGFNQDWLRKNRRWLERDYGFPKPHPAFPARLLYHPEWIEAWHARIAPEGLGRLSPASDPSDELDRRAEEIARRSATGPGQGVDTDDEADTQ